MKVRVIQIWKAKTPKYLKMVISRWFMEEKSERNLAFYSNRRKNVQDVPATCKASTQYAGAM